MRALAALSDHSFLGALGLTKSTAPSEAVSLLAPRVVPIYEYALGGAGHQVSACRNVLSAEQTGLDFRGPKFAAKIPPFTLPGMSPAAGKRIVTSVLFEATLRFQGAQYEGVEYRCVDCSPRNAAGVH